MNVSFCKCSPSPWLHERRIISCLVDFELHYGTLILYLTFHCQWNVSEDVMNRGFNCACMMTCPPELPPSAMGRTCSGQLPVPEWGDMWSRFKFSPHSWVNLRLWQLSPGVSQTFLRLVSEKNKCFFVQVQIVLFPEVMRLLVIQHYRHKIWLIHLATLFGDTLFFPLKLIVFKVLLLSVQTMRVGKGIV